MRIYFATAPSHDERIQALHGRMINEIKRYGQIMCPWKTNGSVMANATRHPDQEIHDQSVRQLEIADVLIAEITQPSLGVGYELCLAEQLDMPNAVLYASGRSQASPIINGARKFNIVPYHDWQDARRSIDSFLNEFKS